MAHWSSGYADFHDELYAPPPVPLGPRKLRCSECEAWYFELDDLRNHMFSAHPISTPTLRHRGTQCGSGRQLIQRATGQADWIATASTWAKVNDVQIDCSDLGAHLTAAQGITIVTLGNDRSSRTYEFDFSIAAEEHLHGVDLALARLLETGNHTSSSINDFIEQTRDLSTARNYSAGISEYLYWRAGRRLDAPADEATLDRNRDKLNKSADLLGDVDRPAALAITSLISLHFNHFDDAANRALNPHLHNLAVRLRTMLAAETGEEDTAGVDGKLSPIEKMLVDERSAPLLAFCSIPLTRATTQHIIDFSAHSTRDIHDRLKVHLFSAEHHLATGNERAGQLVRTASLNGLPEDWVNKRLDTITTEGTTWNTAAAATTGKSNSAKVPGEAARTTSRRTATEGAATPRRAVAPPASLNRTAAKHREAETHPPREKTSADRNERDANLRRTAKEKDSTPAVTPSRNKTRAAANASRAAKGSPTAEPNVPITPHTGQEDTGRKQTATPHSRTAETTSPAKPPNANPTVSDTPPWEAPALSRHTAETTTNPPKKTPPRRRSLLDRLRPGRR